MRDFFYNFHEVGALFVLISIFGYYFFYFPSMEFVNPAFLFGLFAILVPVIIHLFNFRRFRKVYFTNVEFIQELKQETRKQSRLKHLIILLLRILAISALVLAFSRPYIPLQENVIQVQAQNNVSVFIDNSFSMQTESAEGTLLQNALNKAREIADVYSSSHRFQLLTNDFEGSHQRFVSRDEYLDMLDEVGFSASVRNIDEVVIRQSDLNRSDPAKVSTSYILSDFQKHFLSEALNEPDSLMDFYLIPVQAQSSDNLFIDSCWFGAPVQQLNQQVRLFVTVRNNSDNNYEDLPIKLTINGVQKAIASFAITPDTENTIELAFTNTQSGIQTGVLEINDYPVNFDDKFYFSYFVAPQVRVLSINQEGQSFYLNSLFLGDTSIVFENIDVDQLDFSKVQNFDFVVLNGIENLSSGLRQEASRFLNGGGSLLIFPPLIFQDDSYNTFLKETRTANLQELDTTSQRVGMINLDHTLYSGVFDDVPENVDLPQVNKYFVIQPNTRSVHVKLMELQNGNLFLSQFSLNKGKLYLSAVPLDASFSNFPQHTVFVPTLYRMAILSQITEELYYVLGIHEVIRTELPGIIGESPMKITDGEGNFEVIPEHRRLGHLQDLLLHKQINYAGNYYLEYDQQVVRGLSFNYNRTESILECYSSGEIQELLTDRQLANVKVMDVGNKHFGSALEAMSRGIQLWKWFVLATLAFLLVEGLLLRFWKSK